MGNEQIDEDDLDFKVKVNENFNKMQDRLRRLPKKKQLLSSSWLSKKCDFLLKESIFDSEKLKAYSKGEVIFVDLGYNVGNEYGGEHYVVVIKDSTKTEPCLNVVPLTSLKVKECESEEETINSVHRNSLYLGRVEGLDNGKHSIAIINQITTLSKIRIISPKSAKQSVVKLDNDMLDKIDDKIFELYLKKKKP